MCFYQGFHQSRTSQHLFVECASTSITWGELGHSIGGQSSYLCTSVHTRYLACLVFVRLLESVQEVKVKWQTISHLSFVNHLLIWGENKHSSLCLLFCQAITRHQKETGMTDWFTYFEEFTCCTFVMARKGCCTYIWSSSRDFHLEMEYLEMAQSSGSSFCWNCDCWS